MGPGVWFWFGSLLGGAYEFYASALLIGCLGPHFLALGLYLLGVWRPTPRVLHLPIELLYVLLNPVVYLLVFQPALFRAESPTWLYGVAWSLLALYWAVRLVGRALPQSVAGLVGGGIILAGVALVCGLAVRDLVVTCFDGSSIGADINEPYRMLRPVFVAPLYLLPIIVGLVHLRRVWASAAASAAVGSAFFPRGPGLKVALVVSALVGAATVASQWRPSVDSTRDLLLSRRSEIVAASQGHHIDPRLLASIVFVTHREHSTPFRLEIEQVTAAAWLTDPKSHALLSNALNPSIGIAQIKPVTVLTALAILYASGGGAWIPSKEYREVPEEGDAWKRIPRPELTRVEIPAGLGGKQKADVVAALIDPARNLEVGAFLIDLVATQ